MLARKLSIFHHLGIFSIPKSLLLNFRRFWQLIQVHFCQAHSQSQKTNLMTRNENHFFEQKDYFFMSLFSHVEC